MSNLRNKIIRLAYAKPELRNHLLPLLKKASEYVSIEGYFPNPDVLDKAHDTLIAKRLLQNENNWNDSGSETGAFAFAVEPRNLRKVKSLISKFRGKITSEVMYDKNGNEIFED